MNIINKKTGIILSLLLGLCVVNSAFGANDLNKIDIKRSSSSASALNVTIYTANPYDENVAVTKKGDDKYVIIMPNISGVNASNIDYSAIKDIVSDVSLKSINDESSSYTKITLTTTKPVSITTAAKKSTPLTEEQKAYKNLIAQAKGYAQTAQSNNKATSVAKPSQTAQVQPAQTSIKTEQPAKTKPSVAEKKDIASATVSSTVKNEIKQDKDKLASNKAEEKNILKADGNDKKVLTQAASDEISYNKKNIKEETSSDLKDDAEGVFTLNKQASDTDSKENLGLTVGQLLSERAQEQKEILNTTENKGLERNMLTTVIILLSSMFGLMAFFNGIKNSLEGSVALKKSFKDNLHDKPHEPVADYSDITSDNTLSWQEKYQKFINSVEEINPADGIIRHVGNGEYEFVNSSELESIYKDSSPEIGYGETVSYSGGAAQLQPKHESRFKSYNKPAVNSSPSNLPPIKKGKNQPFKTNSASSGYSKDDTRFESYKDLAESLERTLHNSPDVERIDFEDDYDSANPFVHKEEDAISKSIRKAPKLKSFANKMALEETRRLMPSPKHRSDIIKLKNTEAKYVNLENSNLYSSGRSFANANLSSADLINRNKISSRLKATSPIKTSSNDKYATISVDEFFDTMDSSSRITAPATLASRVADKLSAMSSNMNKDDKNSAKDSKNPLDGKIIKAGYNINETSGFYIVTDSEGNCSLIGKSNNAVTVLKEFSHPVEPKIQVRQDGDNVYIVRAAGERYLVEIDGNKMGVLIEL